MAYFQCVYFAWGPVENLTFVCVQSNRMSNQARNACTSGARSSARRVLRVAGYGAAGTYSRSASP